MSSPITPLSSPSSSAHIPTRRKSRVSAEHTLSRVRENQRRHRARRRDYINTLEIQLAETELQLEAARAEIAMLKAERERDVLVGRESRGSRMGFVLDLEGFGGVEDAGDMTSPNKPLRLDLSALRQETGVDRERGVSMGYPASTSELAPLLTSTLTSIPTPTSATAPSLPALVNNLTPECLPSPLIPAGPPPCCTDTSTVSDSTLDAQLSPSSSLPSLSQTSVPPPSDNPECTTCATRPAPSPSESTTLCSQAYMMISQQNFRQIDAATIRLWLWQGYRRAQRRGEGCRVENGVLLSVLDFISGEL